MEYLKKSAASVCGEPAQRFHLVAYLSLKRCCGALRGTWILFNVWCFFGSNGQGFFLLLILVAQRFAVFSFRNPRYLYLFNLPWQLVVSVNRP